MSVIKAGTTTTTALVLQGDTAGDLIFKTGSAAVTAVTFSASANVGIGTSTPGYKLTVQSAIDTYGFNIRDTIGNERVLIGSRATAPIDNITPVQIANDNDGNLLLSSRTNNASGIKFYSNPSATATESARITSTGNVGIGTSSPQAPFGGRALQLGNTSDSRSVFTIQTSTTGLGSVYFSDSPSGGDTYVGYIDYNHTSNFMAFGVGAAERARFNSTGAFVLAGGTTDANGIGITFPASQSASSNANTLDDYEEGTWSPVLSDGTNTVAITSGWYTKVGRMIKLSMAGYNLSTTGLNTGVQLKITGLPFAINSTYSIYANAALAQRTPLVSMLGESNGATEVLLWEHSNSVDYNQFVLSDWGSPANITIRTYFLYEI